MQTNIKEIYNKNLKKYISIFLIIIIIDFFLLSSFSLALVKYLSYLFLVVRQLQLIIAFCFN